jgi:ubiquinone/menaquinone biosynthesis C-methylase UbiE
MSEPHAKSKFEFNPRVDVPAAVYLGQLWLYSLAVLYPAQAAKRLGMFAKTSVGKYPLLAQSKGEGQSYCLEYQEPVYLERESENRQSVSEFDRGARLYESVVAPFTRPVHQEALVFIRRLLPAGAKILDLGCGPGLELCRLAELFPDGEVVGIDLAAEMIAAAHKAARERGRSNTSFFQADVTKLPQHFTGRFDAVHCSFAFHHYSEPLAALQEMQRVLHRDGKAIVIDGGTLWANTLSAPFAKWADPGWVRFHTGEQFQALFRTAGFADFYWEELLPGIGICIGTK